MKKILSLITAVAIMLTALPVQAKTWITLSSWAYNDVSNFRKEGLLPQSMEEISNYTAEITRLQFAEILYNALVISKLEGRSNYNRGFVDVQSEAATALKGNRIIEGEIVSTDEYGNHEYNLNPDRTLTREEMAVMLYRTVGIFARGLVSSNVVITDDFDEISDWAKKEVGVVLGAGIMSGVGDNKFNPKAALTIEQAICAVYRLYLKFPTSPEADGDGVQAAEETFIQAYPNGMTETKKGNILYIKNGDSVVMEFETDIYSCIDAVTVDGKNIAAAQRVNKKTDVYDMSSKEILFTIPYPFSCADEEYIVTESSDIGPMAFGLYDYSGREILEPKYSMAEIEELKANGFMPQQYAYRAPDGWLYYADWHDNGHMYKIDSNGENKQKLSDNDCFNMEYINGWIFYSIRGEDEDKLYCIREDGKYEQRLTDTEGWLLRRCHPEVWIDENEGISIGSYIASDRECVFDDEWVYYSEGGAEDYRSLQTDDAIYRVKFADDGTIVKEKISGDVTLRYGAGGEAVGYKNGALYFNSCNSYWDGEQSIELPESVYRYKDGELKKLSGDIDVDAYGFTEDGRLVFSHTEEYVPENPRRGSYTAQMDVYICDENEENPVIWEEVRPNIEYSLAQDKKIYDESVPDEYGYWYWSNPDYKADMEEFFSKPQESEIDGASNENYTVYVITEWEKLGEDSWGGSSESLWFKDKDGNKTNVSDIWESGVRRVGDVLYFLEHDYEGGLTREKLVAYDMNTKTKTKIADNVRGVSETAPDWMFYVDTRMNVLRFDIATGTSKQIAPNSGNKKYGELYYITRDSSFGVEDGIYKVDVDGNVSLITDDFANYTIYVPKGAKRDAGSGHIQSMDKYRHEMELLSMAE